MSKIGRRRIRNQLLGLVFIGLIGLSVASSIALYEKAFTPVVLVTLQTDRVGNQLRADSDVKVRGLEVGEVREVRTDGEDAEIDLALQPDKAGLLPRNVSARLLPKTLFGERYVNLVIPPERAGASLVDGDVITQDRSSSAIELERVLDDLMPTLKAVQPQKLASTLTAVSTALDGRGQKLGETLVSLNEVLQRINPDLPDLKADISALGDVTVEYDEMVPDLMRTLTDLSVTSRTLDEQRASVGALITDLTTASDDLTGFLDRNGENLIRLADTGRPTLGLLAEHAPEYPCMLRQLNEFKPRMDKALGAGTNEPGFHVNVDLVAPRGAGGAAPPDSCAGRAAPAALNSGGQLGMVNSPSESGLINSMTALSRGQRPEEAADWSSVLVGPLYRGAEVALR